MWDSFEHWRLEAFEANKHSVTVSASLSASQVNNKAQLSSALLCRLGILGKSFSNRDIKHVYKSWWEFSSLLLIISVKRLRNFERAEWVLEFWVQYLGALFVFSVFKLFRNFLFLFSPLSSLLHLNVFLLIFYCYERTLEC